MNGREMSDTKDSAIKLFGKTIPLIESYAPAKTEEKSDVGCQIPENSQVVELCSEITKKESKDAHMENSKKPEKSPVLKDGKEEVQQMAKNGNEMQEHHKLKVDTVETSDTGEDKVLKRPDKIIPCPRCNSLETKFCYFNNYNVNQPRHFCKNCQRYWTAGGTMRNVPVGAGRRRNKQLATQYRQMLVPSDVVPTTRIEIPDMANQQLLSCGESSSTFRHSAGNGTILNFGPEGPLCDSMATVVSLRDQKKSAGLGSVGENRGMPSQCGTSMTTSSLQKNELPEKVMQKEQGCLSETCNEPTQPHPLQSYPAPQLVSPWNPSWKTAASMATSRCSSELACNPDGSNPKMIQWCSSPMLAVPGVCAPSIPLQFVPAPYWGCLPVWAVSTGNMPLPGSNSCLSLSSSTNNSCSGNNSHTLGKHSRDANLMDEEKSEKCVVLPKTVRIDNLDKASKNSIWATLGFKHDQGEIESRGGVFKHLEPRLESKGHQSDGTQVLEANPAALSRSQTFQKLPGAVHRFVHSPALVQ